MIIEGSNRHYMQLMWTDFLFLVTVVVVVVSCTLSLIFRVIGHLTTNGRVKRVPTAPFVLVSGCDSGIGRAAAEALSRAGARVFAGCLRPEEAKGMPEGVEVVPLDVTCAESVRKAVEAVQRRLEEENADLWALVNNAGVCVFGPFEWLTSEQVERQVRVNVLGTMHLTKAFIPLLKPLKGRIVTLSSVNGVLAYPGLSVYSATKFALEGFLDALRLELKPYLEVITVRPGDYARATHIMAGHRENARAMWDALTPAQREEVTEERFWSYHESAMRNCGLSSPHTLQGSPVLRDVLSAVLHETAPSLYVSCPATHRGVYAILNSMPMGCRDRLLGYVYHKLGKEDAKKEN